MPEIQGESLWECVLSGVWWWCVAQRLIEEDVEFVQPASRRNEVLGWVQEGLRDFSISRAAVSWGIPIPRDPSQTVYVWFDALLGYMSGAPSTLLLLMTHF